MSRWMGRGGVNLFMKKETKNKRKNSQILL